MQFQLIDKILEVVPGERIRAVKNLTLGEEYLADHFPSFPVMPGVLMLEAMAQAGAWLCRVTDDFSCPVVVLSEAKGVKYPSFVQPGQSLTLTVEIKGQNGENPQYVKFRGKGEVDGQTAAAGRFVMKRIRISEARANLRDVEERMAARMREQYSLLSGQG